MSSSRCEVVKIIDSDTAVARVNWMVCNGSSGEVETKYTKVLVCRRSTKGLVDRGGVMLSEPLYVATTEAFEGETLFVLVPLDLELLYPSPNQTASAAK